jgi:hypothetical protein
MSIFGTAYDAATDRWIMTETLTNTLDETWLVRSRQTVARREMTSRRRPCCPDQ